MKSAASVIALLVLLVAIPAAAQDRNVDVTVWASSVDMQGTNEFDGDFETEFEDGNGLGVTLNIFWGDHFSTEAGIFALTSDAGLIFSDLEPVSLGQVELVPITLGGQFHILGASRFDPYIGGGAAYVMTENLESDDLDTLGIGEIELDEEVTWFANAGIGFQVTSFFGIALDARYIAYDTTSTSTVTQVEEDFEVTPLFYSAGLRFRF